MPIAMEPIARRNDVGGGALPAVATLLRALGAQVSYDEVLVMSGHAFDFVYDNAAVYEPQRDLHPLDSLMLAVQSAGYSGRWLVDQPAGEVLEHMSLALADERPAIVSLYLPEKVHGFAVAVGCDVAARTVTLQTDQRVSLALPETWWGAVTGPTAWGSCPAFLVERRVTEGWSAEGRLQRALYRASGLLAGGSVPYRDCRGAQEYSLVPLGGRQAAFGAPAYDLLAADVGGAECLGSFALLWRLDAQLSQVRHGREAAAAFFRRIAHPLAAEAAVCCEDAAAAAAELLSRFWYRPTRQMAGVADVLAAAGSQQAMVFWLGLGPADLAALSERVAVTKTPWGPVAVVDTPGRRREASALVERLRRADAALRGLLGDLRDAL